jgi:dynein heavy chain 1, cytosolic
MACDLHLDSTLEDDSEVDKFLEGEVRLFVWISEDDKAHASTESLPQNHLGAIAFCKTGTESLHCMTLAPRIYRKEANEEEVEEKKDDSGGTLDTLQTFTRHCFGPAIQALCVDEEESKSSKLIHGLEDKIRELDVALGQVRRSTLSQIPIVHLATDPYLAKKAQEAIEKKISLTNLDDLGLEEKLDDDDFLNQIQAGVSQWIVQIRKVTVLPSTTMFPSVDSSNSADLEEVSFWLQLEEALQKIPQELSRPDVELTLNLLKAAKRFLATIALDNNTGLDSATSQTNDIAHFLRHYPAPSLEAARDWDKISIAVNQIFDHLPKIRSSRYYDLERCAKLLEATTLTLRLRMVAVLENSSFLFMEFSEYETSVRFPSQDVLVQFDDRYEQFAEFFLEQGRRRKPASGKSASEIIKSITLFHKPLQERLDLLHEFRANHEKLRSVLKEVLGDGDVLAQVEVTPRNLLASLNVLDISSGGTMALERALEEYDRKVDTLEAELATLLRNKLMSCKDAEDMFRVFAKFNPLLSRTRVRAAVKEFQMQLISTVGQAVEKLQAKFTQKYEASSAAKIARLRGIPPVAGKILWAKQMERQVQALMKRMGDVLGSNWGQQLEGRQLRRSGDELLAKLDARAFFRAWITEWEKELINTSNSRLESYPIVIVPEGREGKLVAKANFEEKNELLFREIRHLKWLDFEKDIPRTLLMVSEESVARYPHAVAIKTALRSYSAVRTLITPELEPLVKPQLLAIRECISESFDVKLSSSTAVSKKRRVRFGGRELPSWVTNLTELVVKFEERVEQLLRACDKVDIALDLLDRVDYDRMKFEGILRSIQKSIDQMSLSGYADLDSWVNVVDEKMSEVLARRLAEAIKAWNYKFRVEYDKKDIDDGEELKESEDSPSLASLPKINVPTISVEIVLRNQEITAVPASPIVRSQFLRCLHDFIGIVCNLPRPRSGRFEVFDSRTGQSREKETEDKFSDLIYRVDVQHMREAYSNTELHIREMSNFVAQWCAYQTLWDTRVSDVASQVGEDIDKWQSLLSEASEARAALDSVATIATFGPVNVRYNKVQAQINLKYDSWQKELQSSFASVLAQNISLSHQKIIDAKNKLEQISLDSSSNTDDIVVGVTFIQETKQKLSIWSKELQKLSESELILKRQRHLFHSGWIETSILKGLFENLEQILDKRIRAMEQQVPLLQARVIAEDKSCNKRGIDLGNAWEQDKPLRGNMKPSDALELLSKFEFSLKKVKLDQEKLVKAKDALSLEHTAEGNSISEALEELSDLKEVWDSMAKPYNVLEELKETLFPSAVMRKVRRSLDDLLVEMRALPNKIRQYDAYMHLHNAVKNYVAGHSVMSDLKTEALKERHWKIILQRLGIRVTFSELTVGLLWDHGVLTRKKDMQEILTVAQGEMALEVFLGQVRDRWMKQELELVLYQNRVRLIRGWDELFATLDDHMGGLILMRSSPYYRSVREFQEEGKLWEDRLTKLRTAFDSWVDVQRRWVYLEGILFGSSDIKAQLPSEWSRFKSVDSEFIQLMRRIANRPFAMEALNIENLQRTLERLGNLMGVIQRALGEYLEKQRRDFSRFYFLGDDDLLEIIGNSQEPGKVLAHVAKMFAGIAGATSVSTGLSEDMLTRFDAMVSKDGEIVPFHKPIEVKKQMGVKDWLKQLEERMQSTLALLLEQAVAEDKSTDLSLQTDDGKMNFVEWATKFPAQIMILATLVNWSMSVERVLKGADANGMSLQNVLDSLEAKLDIMAQNVLLDLPMDSRKKFEQLITELVHQRDVTRSLIDEGVSDPSDFRWLSHMRYHYNPAAEKITEKLSISLSNATFHYGFEYLGIGERLVQTPLVDKCWLVLTQALHFRMGGNPFGPAGTGKTESVKALGAQLGRFVLVSLIPDTRNAAFLVTQPVYIFR